MITATERGWLPGGSSSDLAARVVRMWTNLKQAGGWREMLMLAADKCWWMLMLLLEQTRSTKHTYTHRTEHTWTTQNVHVSIEILVVESLYILFWSKIHVIVGLQILGFWLRCSCDTPSARVSVSLGLGLTCAKRAVWNDIKLMARGVASCRDALQSAAKRWIAKRLTFFGRSLKVAFLTVWSLWKVEICRDARDYSYWWLAWTWRHIITCTRNMNTLYL